MTSRMAGILLVLIGGGATWYVWSSALTDGTYDLRLALLGPLLLALGIGYLVHGERMPRRGITRPTRVYGVLGGLASVLNLYLLNAGRDTFVTILAVVLGLALVTIWFLPARMLEDPNRPPSRPKLPSDPIEPAPAVPIRFYSNWPTLKKHPVLGLLLGLVITVTMWLGLQFGMDEARA